MPDLQITQASSASTSSLRRTVGWPAKNRIASSIDISSTSWMLRVAAVDGGVAVWQMS